LQHFDLTPAMIDNATFMRGRGCNHCHHTGFRGRVAVHEQMLMNAAIREMTINREPTQNIRRQARLLGMKTLVEDCMDKALSGMTHVSEVHHLEHGGH